MVNIKWLIKMRYAIYYTDGRDVNMVKFTLKENEKFLNDVTIVVITQVPLEGIDSRYVVINSTVPKVRSHFSLFNQIFEGLIYIKKLGVPYDTQVSFLEHDVLYPRTYFEDMDKANLTTDTYFCNNNLITLRKGLGWCKPKTFHDGGKFIHVLSQMTFDLKFAFLHFAILLRKLRDGIDYSIEPHYDPKHELFGSTKTFDSKYPCVNITDGNNFTNYSDVAFDEANYPVDNYWGHFEIYNY